MLEDVKVAGRPIERFASVLEPEVLTRVRETADSIRHLFRGRVFWNVSSTALGGGVAEMLRPLISYGRGLGVDARWVVIKGGADFFRVTKRIHHALHGSTGDATPLDDAARAIYERTLRENASELCSRVRPHDVVLLHDPQTAGLATHLVGSGAIVVWRCHIGNDSPGEEVVRGWRFLEPYLACARAFVFTRESYVPEFCDHGKATIIPPSIDIFSPKNQELSETAIRTILVHTGLVEGPEGPAPDEPGPTFARDDGSPGRVERCAEVIRLGRPPRWNAQLVVQVSRWDPLKDPVGVMAGFSTLSDGGMAGDAELVLAGPDPRGVADDPEGQATFDQVIRAWSAYPSCVRDRIHLASLPTEDIQENAAIVNALQRHASVVVQKSIHEGFGLTVTEAMWKRRPVLASAVGGIRDQIDNGVDGLLLDDPTDPVEFSRALHLLLEQPEVARRLGDAAHERVRRDFLGVRHLMQYANLIERLS